MEGQMTIDNLTWFLVAMSLTGNVFVIKKNVLGQWLWAAANLGWVFYDLRKNAHSQAFLFSVYFAMCVWGIIVWSKEKKNEVKAS